MILGIISDTHDQLDRIHEAIEVFRQEKVGAVIHCGDFIAPFAIKLFEVLGCPFYSVFGNNDGERAGLWRVVGGFGELYDPPHIFTIAKKRILVSHTPPTDAQVKSNAPLDYVFFGHTHDAVAKTLNGIPAYNPGEGCGWLTGHATIGILDLDSGKYKSMVIFPRVYKNWI